MVACGAWIENESSELSTLPRFSNGIHAEWKGSESAMWPVVVR
jgi:hypothetical protein